MTPRVLLSRLLDLVLRARRDRRLEDELQHHLDLLAEEYEAKGLPRDEARTAARRAFGGVDQITMRYREQRGLPFVESLAQDLGFAVRSVARDRGFALTATLVLALGIGVNNMMFTILYTHTIRSLPLADAGRVVYVSTRDERGTDRGLSWLEFEDARQSSQTTDLAAFVSGPSAVADQQRAPERVERSHVTADTFGVLRISPVIGRVFNAADDRRGAAAVAIVSETMWKTTLGGDASAIGHEVLIDGSPATIVGVIADRSGFPGSAAVWQPLGGSSTLERNDRTARVLRVIGRVRGGHTVDQAMAEIRAVVDRIGAEHGAASRGIRAHVVTINERYLGRASDPAWTAFMTAGFLVLFIAAANVAHLMIGRGLQRAREVAIRASLGASRWRIFRQLLLESAVLAMAGGAFGLGLAVAGVRLFKRGIPEGTLPYWIDYAIDGRVLAALVAVSALTAVLAGAVPGLQASRADANVTLRSGGPTTMASRAGRRWSGAFLVAELALGVVMLANVALAARVAAAALPSEGALSAEDVITASISAPASRYPDARSRLAFHNALDDGLAKLPGVRAFALASVLPVFPAPERLIVAEGGDPRDAIPARQVSIGSRYFDALGLGVEQGRPFANEDGMEGRQHVIVNAHLAERLFPDGGAVGRRIAVVTPQGVASPQWQTIVGVAPVIRQRPQAQPESVVYFPMRLSPPAAASIVMRSDFSLAQMAPLLREAVRRIDPAVPLYDVATLQGAVRRAEWNARLSSSLLVTLTAIAIALATSGLFAVMNRMVAARRREIGVRLALGASPADVARLVVRDAATYVAYGALAGLGAAVAWDAGFGTSARSQAALPGAHLADPLVLLGIAGVLGAVAVVASLAPLRRAVGISPIAVLRED